MANVSIHWDKSTDAAALTGGSWVSSLPLANIKTQSPRKIARSANTLTTSTQFRFDFGTGLLPLVNQFVMLNHNLSKAATIRFVLTESSTNAGTPVYDSGPQPVWVPNVAWGSKPWGQFPWDGIDVNIFPSGPQYVFRILNNGAWQARYLFVFIVDTTNAAGFIQLGRFFAGNAWSPEANFNLGAANGFVDPSEPRRTRGGTRGVIKRPKYRVMSFDLTFDSVEEAYGVPFDLTSTLGLAGEMLVVSDPDEESSTRFRRSIYGALSRINLITEDNYDHFGWRVELEEIL